MSTVAPTLELPHGATMPRIGLGTWPMDDAEAERAVAEALELGYRAVDTAYAYGNERGVGLGLRAAGLPRDEVFVTSKLNADWHSVEGVAEAYDMSLEKLGLDRLDLFLIHWPNPWLDRYVEAYEGLVALLEAGRVPAIGVSNFTPAHLERILAATGVSPDVDQIEVDPTKARAEARAFHAAHGIVTESYSPLGQGSDLLQQPAIVRLAEARERTPAQVVLRWHLQLGLVTIPKSSRPERMRENLDVFDFELTDAEMAELAALDKGEANVADPETFGH